MSAGKVRGQILDEVVSVTGWHAGQRPPPADRGGEGAASVGRRSNSYDASKALQKVWATSGGQCGKYLAASMRTQLDAGRERRRTLERGSQLDGA